MKKVFLDTNVLMDYLLDRQGADYAADILQYGEDNKIKLCMSILSVANIAYLLRKIYSKENLIKVLSDIIKGIEILSMDNSQLKKSLEFPVTDFEDMLQYQCAKAHNCDIIITRNIKHYSFSDINLATSEDFLKEN